MRVDDVGVCALLLGLSSVSASFFVPRAMLTSFGVLSIFY